MKPVANRRRPVGSGPDQIAGDHVIETACADELQAVAGIPGENIREDARPANDIPGGVGHQKAIAPIASGRAEPRLDPDEATLDCVRPASSQHQSVATKPCNGQPANQTKASFTAKPRGVCSRLHTVETHDWRPGIARLSGGIQDNGTDDQRQ